MGARLPAEKRAAVADEAVKLRRCGYKQDEIAKQLGVNQKTVSNYLAQAGEPRKKIYRSPAPAPPEDAPTPAYRQSVTLSLLSAMERELREVNAEHCFAGDVADAREAGDTVWATHAQVVLQAAQAYLNRLHTVLADEQAQACDSGRRDDVAQIVTYLHPGRHRQPQPSGRRWTDQEMAVVRRDDLSSAQVARLLPERSTESVISQRWRLKKRHSSGQHL